MRPAEQDAPAATPGPRRTSLETIMNTEYPPLQWIVEPYFPEGLSILGGKPKSGKSWLALNAALAVGTGGAVFDEIRVEQGDVAYYDLENGHPRVKLRVGKLLPSPGNRPNLDRIDIFEELPVLDKGGMDVIDAWRAVSRKPRLVIIDTLEKVMPEGSKSRTSYSNDYRGLAPLQQWATKHRIGVLIIHHLRKNGATVDDQFDMLSGSSGITAAADTVAVLRRTAAVTSLYVRGRDVEEIETALDFNGGDWKILGEAEAVRRSTSREAILSALREAGTPMRPFELAMVTDLSQSNVRKLLFSMRKVGDVVDVGGRYTTGNGNGGNAKLSVATGGNSSNGGNGNVGDREAAPRGGGPTPMYEIEVTPVTPVTEGGNINDNNQIRAIPPVTESVTVTPNEPVPASTEVVHSADSVTDVTTVTAFPDEALSTSSTADSPVTVASVTDVTGVSDLDGAGLPGPAVPAANGPGLTPDDVMAVVGEVPMDAVRLVRWLYGREDAGQLVAHTACLMNTKMPAETVKACAAVLQSTGHLDVEAVPTTDGRSGTYYRLPAATIEALQSAISARLEREAAARAAAEPQLSLLDGAAL